MGFDRESVGVRMKLTKYVVGTVFNDRIIEKRYLRTKERALKLVPDNQRASYYTKYLGEEEIDLYCESCDKDLSVGDTYIKQDEHIIFTANVPKSDTEIVSLASQLYGTVSDETLFEILSTVTGIDPEVELERIKEESSSKELEPRRPKNNKEELEGERNDEENDRNGDED